MLKSYFLIGLRSLLKQKSFSFIKIAGLAIGLATSIVIYLYILEDLSYDNFHRNHDRIVRVMTIDKAEGVSSKLVAITTPRIGPTAEEELPEVVESVRLIGGGPYELTYNDKPVRSKAAFRADPAFFQVFDFKVVNGPPTGILDKPGSIAITESLAKKIFGSEDPIHKTVKLDLQTELTVTAVLADPPPNSHLQFDVIHTLVTGKNEEGLEQGLQTWESIFARTYLLLDKPLDDLGPLNAKLETILRKNSTADFFSPTTQKLSEVHLHSREILFDSNSNKADIVNIYVLASISALVLVLAVVNFMNLATANATSRARETGMRKVIGAVRQQLIGQHLTESVVITLIAMILALSATGIALPWLNNLYQRSADLGLLLGTKTLLLLGGMVLTVGLLAGLYPAFVLSSFRPSEVLKGAFKSSAHGIRLRKGLVVLQFTISIALIAGTGIVYQQMQFIYSKDLGYNRDQVLTIQHNGNTVRNVDALRNELVRHPGVANVATSSARMGQQLGRTGIFPEGYSLEDTNIITSVMSADDRFIPTMEMKLVSGRNFVEAGADSLAMIVNEELLRLLKWQPEQAIGRKIGLQSGPEVTDQTVYTVVGVVADFHFATIRHKLEPMFMVYNDRNNAMSIRLKAGNVDQTIAHVEEVWKKVNPGTTFEYSFLDDQFATLYRNEKAFSSMFSHFTVLALIIASIGLFALAAFTVEQRRKEIGIRKVLGATNGRIFIGLSSEYITLIAISFPLAAALSYFVMKQWLSDFQYAVTISAGVFVAAGAVALAVSMITVSFQALRAALGNPVNALRSE